MSTYTTVSFYTAVAIAVVGLIMVIASPTRRANLLDALRRHPAGADEAERW